MAQFTENSVVAKDIMSVDQLKDKFERGQNASGNINIGVFKIPPDDKKKTDDIRKVEVVHDDPVNIESSGNLVSGAMMAGIMSNSMSMMCVRPSSWDVYAYPVAIIDSSLTSFVLPPTKITCRDVIGDVVFDEDALNSRDYSTEKAIPIIRTSDLDSGALCIEARAICLDASFDPVLFGVQDDIVVDLITWMSPFNRDDTIIAGGETDLDFVDETHPFERFNIAFKQVDVSDMSSATFKSPPVPQIYNIILYKQSKEETKWHLIVLREQ